MPPITDFYQFDANALLNSQTRVVPIFEERPAPEYPFREQLAALYLFHEPAISAPVPTRAPLIEGLEGREPATVTDPVSIQSQAASQLDRTIATLNQYRVSAGGAQKSATDALQFLEAFPKYLASPKAALSETGVITLFWHEDNFYADAEFHGDGKFSIFTRERVGGEVRDDVLDGEPLQQSAGGWLSSYLGPLLPRSRAAAA